ncbi:MAG TPA: hypothetical protein VKY33_06210, partial [Flavobacterium sp.]|nr:hypothetical protein [Flavobacterium sp.]
MIHKLHVFLSILVCFLTSIAYAQTTDVVHYTQFNGRYDFLMFGNTLNTAANGTAGPCVILTESSADFTLVPGQEIAAAYLYWSGSGGLNDADLDVKLNGIDITAERTWTTTMGTNANLNFFGAFADVTEQVQNTGIGEYTFSDMDLTQVIQPYCSTGLNYGGWAVVVVYQDMSLPNNAVTIYDGFQRVDSNNQNVTMTLSGINVVDPLGARTGFLAWEGDENISVTEELRINNNLISNPPLNPANNAFNCTNSWTGASDLWNMDLDFFDISDYIDTGDTSLDVQLRSGQDGVIINCVVVSLNSELPDATITIDDVVTHCDRREVDVEYTVYNTNATLELPANTPISFYINDTWTASTITQGVIPIDGSESGEITLTVPASISDTFVLKIVVDDDGSGDGIVNEIDETNNEAEQEVTLVFCTDLAITKTAIQDQDDYYFAITVTNIQGLPDSEIEVIDVLPSGYTFVSSTSTQGIYDNETGVWIVGDLDSGASATLRIYVNINDTGSYLNEATVSGENIDINLQNNRDTAKMITLFELNPLDDIHNCESEGNIFNLSQYDTVVYYGNLIVNVDYFNSLDDANANENPITNPGAYEGVDGEMIWVRITHTEVESLYATTSFTLHIHPNPVINPLQQSIYGCEVPGTGGSGEFDLSLNIGNITMNTP